MISPISRLPFVQFEDQGAIPLDASSLIISLMNAAEKSGFHQWQHAEEVSKAVMSYLELQFDRTFVTVAELNALVISVLRAINCQDIAGHFQFTNKQITIYLQELPAEPGFELALFQYLRTTVIKAVDSDVDNIYLRGLKDCVKKMCGLKKWRKSCHSLHDEIVDYLRTTIARSTTRKIVVFIA
ncbi:MAG: hypothetical protein SGI71_07510 [Verrucomicrobiota bacterium]|nr:hypothetical protein [Verrucomicrobiota bacterium]